LSPSFYIKNKGKKGVSKKAQASACRNCKKRKGKRKRGWKVRRANTREGVFETLKAHRQKWRGAAGKGVHTSGSRGQGKSHPHRFGGLLTGGGGGYTRKANRTGIAGERRSVPSVTQGFANMSLELGKVKWEKTKVQQIPLFPLGR